MNPYGKLNKPLFWRALWQLTIPYWRSGEKWFARGMLAFIVGMNLAIVYVNVLLNDWNNDFYNALQAHNKTAFFAALWKFCWLALAYIVLAVYSNYFSQMLQIRWRRWLTTDYLDNWMRRQTYYHLTLTSNTDNPDQRISQDLSSFANSTLSLSLGLLSSVVTLFSFLAILWRLSGLLTIPLGAAGIYVISGYMVWFAIGYAIIGSFFTHLIGRPLISMNFQQQRFEANFRFGLVRLREQAESIALYRGEHQERSLFGRLFADVFGNYWQIMRQQKKLTWFTSGYNQIAIIFPFLVVAPRYFTGAIKLGGLMQTAMAFGQVQGSLSYLVNSYSDIAQWRSVVDRLIGFTQAMETARLGEVTTVQRSNNSGVHIHELKLCLPDGRVLLDQLSLKLGKGDTLLISGPSGSGKSTLLRALAGIWPHAKGHIELDADATILFLPQKPYLPLGSLKAALYYPLPVADEDEELKSELALCELEHLVPMLDVTDNWSIKLSPGEQQRMAFLRLFLVKPDIAFLDEASSALDEKLEAKLYDRVREKLPNLILVSIGHRSTLSAWHELRLELDGHGGWSLLGVNGDKVEPQIGIGNA
ncbi:MAG: ABC transporter ATP-binding protein/permease [Pseudomonadota bacterium]|nr:ABC transporter ATP-binding protein/permease [Pseudomonadota bacterium]